ncbi:MAG: hypothetical protein R2706_11275 [Acidimicrobiales bacterium]
MLNVVIDHATLDRLQREATAEADGALTERPDATEAETYRCETLGGLPVSPALALRIATLGSIRRFVLSAKTSTSMRPLLSGCSEGKTRRVNDS